MQLLLKLSAGKSHQIIDLQFYHALLSTVQPYMLEWTGNQLLIDLRTKNQPLPLCEVQNFTIKQMEYKQVQ